MGQKPPDRPQDAEGLVEIHGECRGSDHLGAKLLKDGAQMTYRGPVELEVHQPYMVSVLFEPCRHVEKSQGHGKPLADGVRWIDEEDSHEALR
jgi:hypothetical protein